MTDRIDPESDISTKRLKSLSRAVDVFVEETASIPETRIATMFGIGRTQVARKLARVSLHRDDEGEKNRTHVFLGETLMLPVDAMLRIVNRLFLEPNGYAAVKLPDATKSGSNLELVTSMHREASEATNAVLVALSKGHMDRAKALAVIKEGRESIAVQLEAIAIAESALREGVVSFNERAAS